MKSAIIKLKSTLLSLGNCGVHEEGLNPITSKHIYKTIVLPKALYGCEIWDNLSTKHLNMLKMAHRFCVKCLQSLPKRTNTDLALSLINLQNIEHEIDYRKLVFLRQLCCLPLDYTAKEIFLYRLVNFNGRVSSQRGFIPDIHRILGKYSVRTTRPEKCDIFAQRYQSHPITFKFQKRSLYFLHLQKPCQNISLSEYFA